MKLMLKLGQLSMLLVWVLAIFNLFQPLPGNAAIALYIFAPLTLMLHGLQLIMFVGSFGDQMPTSGKDKLMILFFGVFALLEIRGRLHS